MTRKQDHPTKVNDIISALHRRKPQWKPTKHLILLPLEPMEERYTAQWLRWFEEELARLGIPYTMFLPSREARHIARGTVLDAAGTVAWKSEQMKLVSEWFSQGHGGFKDITVLTMDAQHPGIEAIKYMSHLYGVECRIFGYLHASSYTTEDFTAPMAPWLRDFEHAWFSLYDGLFVGSRYHADKAIAAVNRVPWEFMDKFHVVRAPFMEPPVPDGLMKDWRPIDVIWPHRFDREKRPNRALEVFRELKDMNPDYRFVVCTSRPVNGESVNFFDVDASHSDGPRRMKAPVSFNTNDETMLGMLNQAIEDGVVEFYYCMEKADYYHLLLNSTAMLSTTIEENFGYCFVEAVHHGCVPIVPDNFSHPEFIEDEMMWIEQGVEKPDPQAYFFGVPGNLRGTIEVSLRQACPGTKTRDSFQALLRYCQDSIAMMMDVVFPPDPGDQEDQEVHEGQVYS